MRILAILTDRNHKRIVRHVAHSCQGEVDFFAPDEIIDIESHIQYDKLIIAASYEETQGEALLRQLHSTLPNFIIPPTAAIDNGDIELESDQLTILSEYHLENALNDWLVSTSGHKIPKSVLYISDDRLMHAIIKDLFKLEDTTVIHAYDGLSGYEIYKDKKPNLILTDLDIPLLDGFGLLKRIKEQDGDLKIPVLIFSSTSDEKTIMEAYRLRAKGYLIKPMALQDLKHKVEKHLNSNAN